MNILIVSNMFHPIRTGSSNYTLALAKTLHNHNQKVVVVSVKLRKYDSNNDTEFPFKVFRLPCIHFKFKNLFNWFTVVSFNILNYFRLYKIIKDEHIDIVHQVNHYLDTAILTRIVCPIAKVPFVVSVHTQLQFKKSFYASILIQIDKLISGKFILKKAATILSFNSEVLRYLDNTYEKLIHHSKIDTKILRGIRVNLEDYPQKNNYDLSNYILSVGHLINIRNRINLIKAIKLVIPKYPFVRLEIVGHIYIPEPLQLVKDLKLENNVYFTGELSRKEIKKKFLSADIHAVWVTSEYVGLGTAISESMLSGVPVINNSPHNLIGNNKLEDMKNIVLIKDDNIEKIAQKIIVLLDDKKLRENIGKAGRDLIYNNYNFDNVINTQINLYNSLM